MTKKSTPIINHYVALIKLDPFEEIPGFIEAVGQSIVADMKLNVVRTSLHNFEPHGITLTYILSESHFAIHTWPEFGVIHMDLVTCSSSERAEFEKSIKRALNGREISSLEIKTVNLDTL